MNISISTSTEPRTFSPVDWDALTDTDEVDLEPLWLDLRYAAAALFVADRHNAYFRLLDELRMGESEAELAEPYDFPTLAWHDVSDHLKQEELRRVVAYMGDTYSGACGYLVGLIDSRTRDCVPLPSLLKELTRRP